MRARPRTTPTAIPTIASRRASTTRSFQPKRCAVRKRHLLGHLLVVLRHALAADPAEPAKEPAGAEDVAAGVAPDHDHRYSDRHPPDGHPPTLHGNPGADSSHSSSVP